MSNDGETEYDRDKRQEIRDGMGMYDTRGDVILAGNPNLHFGGLCADAADGVPIKLEWSYAESRI